MSLRAGVPVHGGNLWAAAQRRGIPAEEWLDFSADLNPWARDWVPAVVVEEAWRRIQHYPDPMYLRFRQATAAWDKVEVSAILPGNGTADLIHLISRWRKAARAWIPVPTFTEYARAVRSNGGTVTPGLLSEQDDFGGSGLLQVLKHTPVDVVFLCNPNNPTGRIWPREAVLELLEWCARNQILLVVDEAYMDLTADGLRYSLAGEAARNRHLLVLRSLTKAFGIPGLRLGYAVGHPSVIEPLQAIQPPWPVNTLAAEAGTWLLESAGEALADSRRRLAADREEMREALSRLPQLRLFSSEANFFLACLNEHSRGAQHAADQLEKRGILIRRCDDFEGLEPDRFLRMAVRRPEENRLFVQPLAETLDEG